MFTFYSVHCNICDATLVYRNEGINQLSTVKLISLSEQELVDCDTSGEDQGCNGGLMDQAFKFIIQNKGLTTESNYPYEAIDGTCSTSKESSHATNFCSLFRVKLVACLWNAKYHLTTNLSIITNEQINVTQLDHGVAAIVEYGTTTKGTK
ncbi:Peptidase C1A, papain [Cynara cardunculus var. scolymus]|uniref:Peptidase C1A, papain n=1 Tax=Cynara cardunculus var. scolymus TaxID=59895 RepID=A0A103XUB3_CYNCS|nr:Peptidase C1A, papain [Cynara cardunculus var. scolymus]